ncbi:maleylpyruvate isomerase N-terminal domain-containing protein [uncultured Mameliella sp.]|uniref:maleylpyruvate isomerase N-terminal domain-containing protein n=1 Tax=uncultured Mameliella sp. TaxID=1447087 RepID=UPI00260DD878|nr:maleylpyruvate isomerase N-terminal domain-containing protein [uncultured Mameliella sp.]
MSLTAGEQAAREALRARQGAGARYDAASAPAEDLLLARRGTAYFARKLGELSDAELDAPSLREDVRRRALIAQVGYHARALAQQVAAARAGEAVQPISPKTYRNEIAQGATLPPRALCSLVHHAAIHLDVEWRDLTGDGWELSVPLDGAEATPLRQTPRLRARVVWQGALDLGNGGRLADVPADLRAELALPGGR